MAGGIMGWRLTQDNTIGHEAPDDLRAEQVALQQHRFDEQHNELDLKVEITSTPACV